MQRTCASTVSNVLRMTLHALRAEHAAPFAPAGGERPTGRGSSRGVFCVLFARRRRAPDRRHCPRAVRELNAWAARESARLLAQQGLHATLRDPGQARPARSRAHRRARSTRPTARAPPSRATASARARGSSRSSSGKLVIDQIEIDEPAIRLVMKDGELQNLPLQLRRSPTARRSPSSRRSRSSPSPARRSTLASTRTHLVAQDIDVDLTTDDDGPEGSSFEIATRIGQTDLQPPAPVPPELEGAEAATAYDDDALCSLDARVRYEPHRPRAPPQRGGLRRPRRAGEQRPPVRPPAERQAQGRDRR